MMKQIGHKSVVHLTGGMRVPNGSLCSLFFGIGPQKMGHSFGFNQREKEGLGGLEP
jgi:hypothetical protein